MPTLYRTITQGGIAHVVHMVLPQDRHPLTVSFPTVNTRLTVARSRLTKGGDMEYTIEVDVLVTRTYTVEADSPGDALAIYRDGDADICDGDLFESNWDEQEHTARVLDVPACEHVGEPCDGAEFCKRCGVQIFSGYVFGNERYCNNHEPETWKAELATMTEEEFDNQDDIYWTEWEIVDIFCECPIDCQCRPSPEALQVLYDADRAKNKG